MKNNDSKRFLFADWNSWRVYKEKAVVGFAKGFISILYAIFVGIATLLYNAFMAFKAFVVKYPVHSLAALCVILSVVLMFNYIRFSVKAKTAEAQRDSIGYELYKIEQALGGDTIIIGGKTKKQNYQKTKQKEENED